MSSYKSESHKRRATTRLYFRIALFTIVAGVIILGGLRIYRSIVPTHKELHTSTQSSAPVRTIPGTPLIVDKGMGIVCIPLLTNKSVTNLAIYNRKTGQQHILFNRAVSIIGLSAGLSNGESILVFGMAVEDTNRNGRIDPLDNHQLYYYRAVSGEIHQFSKPIYNFTQLVGTLDGISTADGISRQGPGLIYKVTVDINHNGNLDTGDPVQYVVADLSTQTISEMLPETIVPTSTIKESKVEPDLQ